ncbi:hypothetical protein LINPERPRIM_LOCUS36039 [Linum perenne]
MLALMAVQRQRAASRSTSPWIRLQQGLTGGFPIEMLSRELSTLAQTPNLRASMGHFWDEGLGVGVGFEGGGGHLLLGFGGGGGGGHFLGLGGGGGQPGLVAETMVKKRRFRARKRAKLE